jgi:molecular chaperone GrpE
VLPTLDDLARVAATPTETTSVEALEKGVELILRNLKKHLEEAGLEPIEAEGRRFDPEEQQAVLLVPTEDPSLDETVSRVFLQGYRFRDRLLRPAQVEVRRYEPDGGDAAAGGADVADGEA